MKIKPSSVTGIGLALFLTGIWPQSLRAYEEIAVKDGATIHGSVKVEGKLPPLAPLEITKFKEVCKNVPNESLIVGPGRGLRYAVVTLEGITKGKAVEREIAHELDNVQCRFSPHVQAASVGQFVVLKNTDPILHTAHAIFSQGQPQFNVGLYPGRTTRKPLVVPGLVTIHCDVHPWMSAYIVVTEHPYHAISDLYGEYEIGNIPPGQYRLKIWHETLGIQEKSIEVKAGARQTADFTFNPSPGAKK